MQKDYSEFDKKQQLLKVLFEEPISAEDFELTPEEEKVLLMRGLPLSVKGSFDKQESDRW